MNIAQVRAQYPQYQDLSDKQLADALHAKFYSDIPIQDYYSRIGLTSPKERTWGEAAKDIAAGVVSGAGSLVQLPGQLYGLATGDFSETGALGLGKDIAKFGEEMKSAGLKAREAERAQKIKSAEEKGQWEAFKTAFGETVKDPALLTSFLAEQAPQLLVPFGAAKVAQIGTAAKAAAAAEGLVGKAASDAVKEVTKAAAERGTRAAIGAGAVQQGADVGAQAYEDIYKELIRKGADPKDAADGALNLARAAGASGAIVSLLAQRLPGARSLEESFAGVPGKGGRLLGAVKGAAGEGISEIVEETGGKFGANLAMREVAPETSLTAGLGETAGMAAIGGVGMGGAAGLARRPAMPEPAPAPVAPPVQPPAPPVGALEYKPEPYIQFPDGTVAKRSEVEAYIKTLPEDQQMAMRAKLLGLAPQEAEKEPAPPAKALEYKPEPLIVYPDGSVAKRSEVDAYIQGLPEDEQIPARAKLLGMGEEATQVTPEMLRKLGIRGRAPIIQRLTGLELTDPKVAEELTNFAQQSFASPEVRGNIFGFLNTLKTLEAPKVETPKAQIPPSPPAPPIEPPAAPPVEPPKVEAPTPLAQPPSAPKVEAAAPPAFESKIVSRQPAPDGMEVHVFTTTDGYGTGLFDADAGQYVNGSVTRFAGADTLPKAEARAAEMLRKATPAEPAEPSVEPLGTRKEAQAFGKAIGATQPYPGELRGRVNLPAQKAAKEGNFQGVLSALEKSKNVIVAEIAKRARALGTKIVIDDDAEETYTGPSTLMRQMSIDGAKMHLEALNKIRALAPQVDALPDKAELSYAIRGETINAIDGGESAGRMYLEDIAKMGHSMFAPLPIGESKFKTKEDFKRLQKAYEDLTSEYGENALQLTSTGSAQITGVAGVYDAATDTIRVPEYTAKREEVLSHEIVHAQTVQAIANPSLRQKPIVARLNKLYEHVKKELEVRPGFSNSLRRAPYGIQSIQEFVAEGMGNPAFQFLLKKIKYENTSAWDSFVQTIANLIGVKRDTAFTELLSIYSDLTTEQKAAPKAKAPAVEATAPKAAVTVEPAVETAPPKAEAPAAPAAPKQPAFVYRTAKGDQTQMRMFTEDETIEFNNISGQPQLVIRGKNIAGTEDDVVVVYHNNIDRRSNVYDAKDLQKLLDVDPQVVKAIQKWLASDASTITSNGQELAKTLSDFVEGSAAETPAAPKTEAPAAPTPFMQLLQEYWGGTVTPAIKNYLDAFNSFGADRLEANQIKPAGMSPREWLESFVSKQSTWDKGRRTGVTGIQALSTKNLWPTTDGSGERLRKAMLEAVKALKNAPGSTGELMDQAFAEERKTTAVETTTSEAPPILDTTGIKEVKGRHPQVQAAAKLLQDKKMTREEFEKYVDYYKPIQEVEAEKLLPPTSEQRMNETVNADKRDKINVPVADGTKVGLRMDLPARERGGSVVSIHEGKPGKLTVGKLMGFRSTGWLKDVTFEVRSQEKGLAVATGAAKAPQQTVEGTWFNLGPEETYARVKELMKDPAWTQVGFDPSRHGYFYDRKTREPVVSASEMYQVGQFLLAKDVKYAPKTDFLYSLGKEQTRQLQDFQQTLRNLLNKFGLKDVGLNIEEGMRDAGSYSQQLIRIAADEANPIRTLRHEAIHALRELGFFTDAQWNSLSKMAKDKWIDQYLKQRNEQGRPLKAGEESRYDAYMREYNGDMEKITEEAVADAFADFDATKPPAGMLQALFKRMKDLFQSIKSALTKIESPEQIFGKVEKGELRAGTREARGEAKSLRDRATANFLRWFGNSKVVDMNGEPLVVYHGSKSDITEFDPSKGAAGNQGMFFTTDIDLANVYGKDGAVYPVYVSIKNPLILQGNERFAPQGIKGKLAKLLFPTQYKKAEREQRVKDMLFDGNAGRIFSKQDVELLRREGYDGVVTMNAYPEGSNLQVIVAFDPVQIKSAIGNNGDYSLTNADIRKSLGKTASPGQQALATINRMGMGIKPPEPGRIEKAKAYLKEAGENPAATKESAKQTLTKWLDAFETMAFSGDAAFNNKITSSVIKDMKEQPELLGLLLEASQSQAVNADNVVSRGIIEGSIEYNEEMKKWQSVKKDENFSALAKKLDDLAQKYGTSKEEMERIAHTYLVVKRLPGIIQRNKDLDAAIEKEQATAKPDRKRIDEWKALKVYVSPEQEAQVEPGLSLIKTIPELKEVSDIWQGIRQNTIKAMVDSGLWSPEYATNMFDNIDYVPYFREEQLEEGAGPLEFIRGLQVKSKEFQLKGSGAPVNDVFDNMIRWSQYAMNRAIRAQKARQMIDAAKDIDIGDRKMAVRVSEEKRGMNIVRVFRDGKQELWDMADPMFVPAFSAIQNVSIPMFKWAAKVADVLRNSVVLYPMFSVAQVPQDSFAAMFTSGLKPQHALKIPYLAVKEFVKTLSKSSATHNELVKFGVVGARDFSADVMRKDAEIYAGLKPPKGGWGKTKEVLEHIAMAADNAVRQAVYEASVDQGLSKAEALEKAFEIFNVRRRGTSKALNLAGQTIPFFYAYLAAQRVAYRTITGVGTSPTERKAALQTLAATSAAVFTLSMLYAMAVGDDEDYAETPAAVRDRTLTIPGTGGVRIPLRTDFFLFPKIIAEHTYLMLTDKGYEDGAKFRRSMRDALVSAVASPTPLPQIVKPALEVAINYDFFTGKPVIGQFEKQKDWERQFNDSTSELSKLLGQTGLVSPIAVDHLIRGMFGSAGGLVMYASNFFTSDPDVPRPELSVNEMLAALPGTSGFLKRPQESALKNDFYTLRDEVEKAVNTFNDIKTRSPQGMEAFLEDEKQMARLMLGKPVDKINRELSKIRRQMTIITNMPENQMSAEDKADNIRQLREMEREMLKSVNVKELREMAKI